MYRKNCCRTNSFKNFQAVRVCNGGSSSYVGHDSHEGGLIEGQIEVKISTQSLDFKPELVHQAILEVVVVACKQIKFQTCQE
jgi:hypothetical protein